MQKRRHSLLRALALGWMLAAASGCFATSRVFHAASGSPKGPHRGWVLQHAFLLTDGSVLLHGEKRGLVNTDSWVVQITPEQMTTATRGADARAHLAVPWERWQVPVRPLDPVAVPASDGPPDATPTPEDVEACSSFLGGMRRIARSVPVLAPGQPDTPGEPAVVSLRRKVLPEGDDAASAPPQILLRRIPMAGVEGETREDLAVSFLAGHVEGSPGALILLPFALALDAYVTSALVAFGPPFLLITGRYRALIGESKNLREESLRDEARASGCRCVATFSPAPFQTVRACYQPLWWTP